MIIFILYYSANCADWFSFILQEPKINFPLQLLYVLNITIHSPRNYLVEIEHATVPPFCSVWSLLALLKPVAEP